jgi:gluconolactonase
MKPLLPLLGLLVFGAPLSTLGAERAPHVFKGRIERLDPAFDQLVAKDAALEKLAEGFTWAEGPVWLDGALLFSDVPQNTIYRWKPGATKAEVFLKPSGQLTPAPGFREPGSNGLTHDARGRLLLAQHGERRIARYEDGKFTALAERFEGKRFNSPNDLVVRRNGDIYFTDPPYGLEGIEKSPLRELTIQGVFRLTPDGKVTLLASDILFPNGIAFSPDEKTLYVGSTDGKTPRIMAFDVRADGSVANERLFFDAVPVMKDGTRGGCDGMKVDRDGNVWTTGPGGIVVISPTGKILGRLLTGEPTANCGWGDDGSTLYITANMFLLRLKTTTKGAGW